MASESRSLLRHQTDLRDISKSQRSSQLNKKTSKNLKGIFPQDSDLQLQTERGLTVLKRFVRVVLSKNVDNNSIQKNIKFVRKLY